MRTTLPSTCDGLFDRLSDSLEAVQAPSSAIQHVLNQAVQRDLLRLFNTRNGLTPAQFLACEGGVLSYGLPDLLGLSPQSDSDLALLRQVLQHALTLYEPRLQQIRLEIRRDPMQTRLLRVAIAAMVPLNGSGQRLVFELGLSDQQTFSEKQA